MPRGLKELDDEAGKRGGGGGITPGSFILHLRLRDDKERARVRFLTDYDSIFWDWFHGVKETTGSGKTLYYDVLCGGEECTRCGQEGAEAPSERMLVWAFVRYVDWRATGKDRQQVVEDGVTYYREHINGVRLLRMSTMHRTAFLNVVNFTGTLVDRDYDFVRAGVKGTQRPSYSLAPVKGTEGEGQADDLVKLAAELPDLEDVAARRVQKLDVAAGDSGYRVIDVPLDGGGEAQPTEASPAGTDEHDFPKADLPPAPGQEDPEDAFASSAPGALPVVPSDAAEPGGDGEEPEDGGDPLDEIDI